jgi:hypothetical protein
MKTSILLFVCLVSFLLLHCTGPTFVAGLLPNFSGKILNEENLCIDSAKVEVIDIDDVGHDSIDNYLGRIYYSDKDGSFRLSLPGGIEWKEYPLTDTKHYIKYVENVTIKVSKPQYKDTIVTFHNSNYEKSSEVKDIILKTE